MCQVQAEIKYHNNAEHIALRTFQQYSIEHHPTHTQDTLVNLLL